LTELVTTNSGFFPRPDYLIDAYRKVGGLQKEGMSESVRKELMKEISSARKQVIELQQEAGIDLLTEGQLHWDDLLAYPATKISGIEMGGLIRYYSTNRFYRRPMVKSDLNVEKITVDEYKEAVETADRPVKPILPGPLTLADLLENQYYDSSSNLMNKITDILISEINHLAKAGAEIVQLDEPCLTAGDVEIDPLSKIHSETKTDLEIKTYFGEVVDVYPELIESCDCVGLDLTTENSNWDALMEYGVGKNLSAGIITTRNTKIESEETLRKRVDRVLRHTDPDKLYITTNTALDFLPWKIMLKKIELLGSDIYDR